MSNNANEQDAILERNLRMMGRVLDLPSPGSSLRWKHAPAAEPSARRLVLSTRFFAALGTAAAAALAFIAFMLPSGPGSTAVASSIFRSIREGSHRSLSFTFDKLESGGLLVSGRLQMLFDEDVTLAQLFRSGARPEPEWLGLQMQLRGTAADPRVDGLDCEIAASLTHKSPWAYVRLDQLPTQTAASVPLLGMLVPTLRSGLILELDNPSDLVDCVSGGNGAILSQNGAAGALSQQTSAVGAPEAAPGDALPTAPGGVSAAASGGTRPAGPSDASRAAAPVESPLERLVFDFLSGRAGGDRVAELVARIEEVAEEVSTRRVDGREWELRASRFRLSELSPDEAALLGDASLLIRYEPGVGLIEVELTRVGTAHGRIRLGFSDPIDPRLEDKAIYTAAGAQSLRLADVLRVFE
ncbi:MAG: hypothetical protein IT450_19095 [Phycisphaerales bacterium]|nr:hypothetical protein [Phycisphaerales bacterium]